MNEKINPIRETNDEAIATAKQLITQTRYAAIGVKEVESGVPLVSRIAIAFTQELGLFFCASDLSMHSQCLKEDGECSLLLGEPGKGDGLAYPRITVIGKTQRLPNKTEKRSSLREAFLKVHPKAELYIDFADFGFYLVDVERAQLNGGFGKAFHLSKSEMEFLY